MTTMRRTISLLLVGAVAAFAVACRESAVAPANPDSDANFASSARGLEKGTTVISTFEISPNGGTYNVGGFQLVVPAGAVCDPASTNYGSRYWNDDCAPLNRSITIKLVAETHRNHVSVDFQPDLRFRPAAGAVTIRTSAYRELLTSGGARQMSPSDAFFRALAIMYVPSGRTTRIDEVQSLSDRSLVTYINRSTGTISRRIQHFSGFLVSSGFSCNSVGGEACEDPNGGLPPVSGLSSQSVLASPMSIVVLDEPAPADPAPSDSTP